MTVMGDDFAIDLILGFWLYCAWKFARILERYAEYEQENMQNYFISIFYSEEDKDYIADIPDLRFCSVFGETPEETLREVRVAKEAWLETARARGKPIPKPQYRPAIY